MSLEPARTNNVEDCEQESSKWTALMASPEAVVSSEVDDTGAGGPTTVDVQTQETSGRPLWMTSYNLFMQHTTSRMQSLWLLLKESPDATADLLEETLDQLEAPDATADRLEETLDQLEVQVAQQRHPPKQGQTAGPNGFAPLPGDRLLNAAGTRTPASSFGGEDQREEEEGDWEEEETRSKRARLW